MANRLTCEGPDDRHVIANLLFNHGLTEKDIDYKAKNGIDRLLDTLEEEIRATDAERIGIVIDADLDLGRRWSQLVTILTRCGYLDIPTTPGANGTILENDEGQRLGIWLMPDNRLSGILEDFVAGLINEGDDLWLKANDDVNAIPEDRRRYKKSYHSKAKIHTWLAWQEEPGTRMGECFKKKYLNPEHPQASVFVGWINALLA
jgi:hypothetical protein